MSLSMLKQINRRFPALKAPAHASPGQRPGFPSLSIAVRPEGAQCPPSAPSGRKIGCAHEARGVAPG
jgi:hypothetical protein